jgi:hypothetical protein
MTPIWFAVPVSRVASGRYLTPIIEGFLLDAKWGHCSMPIDILAVALVVKITSLTHGYFADA